MACIDVEDADYLLLVRWLPRDEDNWSGTIDYFFLTMMRSGEPVKLVGLTEFVL